MASAIGLALALTPAAPWLVGCEYVAGIDDRKAGLGGLDEDPGDDAGEDAALDVETELPATDAAGGSCIYDMPVFASVSGYSSPTSLVRLPGSGGSGGLWALTWTEGLASLRYNAVDAAGVIVHPDADVVMVQADSQTTLNSPRLAWSGTDLILAYARHEGTGSGPSWVAASRLDPDTGLPIGDEAPGFGQNAVTMPWVSDVVFEAEGHRFIVSSRTQQPDLSGTKTDLFTADPVHLTAEGPAPDSYGTAATWSPGAEVFAVAMITDGAGYGGELRVFNRDLSWHATHPFTAAPGDSPRAHADSPPAIVGVGTQLYVAWVNRVAERTQVALNAVDAVTGTHMKEQSVPVSKLAETAAQYRTFPRITYDGTHIVVGWVEVQPGGVVGQIRMRRYNTALAPIGEEICPSCVVEDAINGEFALATNGLNRYAVAFYSMVQNRHYLVQFTCNSP